MKVITLNLSEIDIAFLDELTGEGLFPSRSETMRHLMRLAIPILREQIVFEQRVISKNLIPFKEAGAPNDNNAFRGIPLSKDEVKRFNKSQDMFYLIPDNEKPCKYKILKRL